MKHIFLVAMLSVLVVPHPAEAKNVEFYPGKGGDLLESRLYYVNFSCGMVAGLADGFVKNVYVGLQPNEIVLNKSVTLYTSSANTLNGAPAETQIFSANVFTHSTKYLSHRTDFDSDSCSGQFFISGAASYRVEARLGITTTGTFSDFVARVATLATSASTALYGIVQQTKPPEFDRYVENSKNLLLQYDEFRQLFGVRNPPADTDRGELAVGQNIVVSKNRSGQKVAWFKMDVQPVVSLVKDKKTKFLSAYNASAGQAAALTGATAEALRNTCKDARQNYFISGIQSDYDIAYLLYRRLLSTQASRAKIVQCLGRELGAAALAIMDKIPATDEFRIDQKSLEDYLPQQRASNQPHEREALVYEMNGVLNEMGRHLLNPTGLRGNQRERFLSKWSDQVVLEDQTVNYKAFSILFPGQELESISLNRVDLFETLRKTKMLRWSCLQRTRRDRYDVAPLYDPEIDAAIMLIAAQGEAKEVLDYNKSVYFGVHVSFEDRNAQRINKLVFEDRFMDTLLLENPRCMANVPAKPGTAPPQAQAKI